MTTDPLPIVFSVLLATGAFVLVAFGMYRGGGADAIRHQIPALVALGLVMLLIVVLLPVLNDVLGLDAVSAILVVASLGFIGYRYRTLRRRSASSEVPGLREALTTPAVSWFLAGWAALVIALTLGLIVVAVARR
jgi:uncharacterized membrane protein